MLVVDYRAEELFVNIQTPFSVPNIYMSEAQKEIYTECESTDCSITDKNSCDVVRCVIEKCNNKSYDSHDTVMHFRGDW